MPVPAEAAGQRWTLSGTVVLPAGVDQHDPWPELPDDSPLWIPPYPAEDPRHLRRLAAEQRGD